MTKAYSEQALRDVLAVVFRIPADSISDQTSMDTVASWDSVKHMNLVLAIEEEFGITIPDEDAANITSFPLIKLVLNEQLQAQ